MSSNGQDLLKRPLSRISHFDIQEWNSELRNLEIFMEELTVEKMKEKIVNEQKIADDIKAKRRIEFVERERRIRREEKKILRKETYLKKQSSLLEAAFSTDEIVVKKVNLAKAMTNPM